MRSCISSHRAAVVRHATASPPRVAPRARTTRASTSSAVEQPSRPIRLARSRVPQSRASSSAPPSCAPSARGPTSTHAVWLPSTIRCSRSHVVNGSRRSASAGASATSNTTRPKLPACSTSVSARDRLLERALVQIAAQPGIRRRRGRGSRAADRDRCRPPPPTRRRTCRAHRRAPTSSPRAVAAASICSSRLVRPDDRGPTSSDSWPRGNPPPQPRV